jgi:hypothetical protein
MPLLDLDLPIDRSAIPPNIAAFLREAERRVKRFQRTASVPGFVPSDFLSAYAVLRTLATASLENGRFFCEWGSGFGVVACLADLLEFEAYGIEIEGTLVEAARQLASDYELSVQFVQGSFIPEGDPVSRGHEEFTWLCADAGTAHEELGLNLDDFAVIFAYPWPDEEQVINQLFERHAGEGAVLVTHHGGDEFRLQRKTRKSRRGAFR